MRSAGVDFWEDRTVARNVLDEIYRLDGILTRLDALEKQIFDSPDPKLVRRILDEKRQVAALRRIMTPQRDVVARLARRDFVDVSTEMSFRFRDVYDHLVRIADDSLIFQDRVTGVLDAHLSNVSNRLNEIMKVLTIVSVLFLPLVLLTLYPSSLAYVVRIGGLFLFIRTATPHASRFWRARSWRIRHRRHRFESAS